MTKTSVLSIKGYPLIILEYLKQHHYYYATDLLLANIKLETLQHSFQVTNYDNDNVSSTSPTLATVDCFQQWSFKALIQLMDNQLPMNCAKLDEKASDPSDLLGPCSFGKNHLNEFQNCKVKSYESRHLHAQLSAVFNRLSFRDNTTFARAYKDENKHVTLRNNVQIINRCRTSVCTHVTGILSISTLTCSLPHFS